MSFSKSRFSIITLSRRLWIRKQGKDVRVYKELLCDPHVFACVQSRKSGVLSLEWEINRGLDKDEKAEAIENLLKQLDIHKLISDILDATQCGFQPLEIIWKAKHLKSFQKNLNQFFKSVVGGANKLLLIQKVMPKKFSLFQCID